MVKGPTFSNALLILFPGYNTLDVNGPYETLRSIKFGEEPNRMFKITIAAEQSITVSAEGMKIERDVPLDSNLMSELGNYDLLIVPGGPPDQVEAEMNRADSPFNQVIKAYSTLDARSDSLPRILLSICTGALFLAKQSVFNDGRYCTTHWAAYPNLVKVNNEVAALGSQGQSQKIEPGVVLPARFVDSGLNKKQIRIISAGGVSCGIDASLHVVRIRAEILAGTGQGEIIAAATAKTLDYAFRFTEGVVFNQKF